MKLNCLRIFVDGAQIRDIEFKDGLNLVLNKRGVGRSGNSVGKTTLARVMDYLFLGGIGPIYIDEEFKKPNEKIENLFLNSSVYAELEFVGLDHKDHKIARNLSIDLRKRKYIVDGDYVEEDEYEAALLKLFFDVSTKRPSVRALAPKFIRNDSHKMLNTIKFLDKRASSKDYSEIFLYLFGFNDSNLLTEKREATNRLNLKKKHSQTLNALVKEQKPAAEIRQLKVSTEQLEREILRFDYSPKYQNPLEELRIIQSDEDAISALALDLDRRISNIDRTVKLLQQQGGNYIVNEVRAIYEYAGVALQGAIKDFEDVLSFHDKLVSRKKQFVDDELPALRGARVELESQLDVIKARRSSVFSDMRSEESISKITGEIKALGELKVKLGRLEGLLSQQEKANEEVSLASEQLRIILVQISKALDTVKDFTDLFNAFFREITSSIHAEAYEFDFKFIEDTGLCHMEVVNNVSNPEGGKKKAEVIAFDLAYIAAVNETALPRPTFVFHDSIEDIDQKQIDTIFRCADLSLGQNIISMLSDRFSEEMYREYLPSAILLLAEDDMFFKV